MSAHWSRARAVLGVVADIGSICSAVAILVVTTMVAAAVLRGQVVKRPVGQGAAQSRPQGDPVSNVVGLMTTENETSIHPLGASVAVVEFADFECRFCGQYDRDIYPLLKQEFVDTRRVAYVYRDFPIERIHPLSIRASGAAECARSQGKYWEMHSRLFVNQENLQLAALVADAKAISLQVSAFEACMGSPPIAKVLRDQEVGRSLGVTVTPTFFVGMIQRDGRIDLKQKISGAQRIDVFRRAIGAALEQASAGLGR